MLRFSFKIVSLFPDLDNHDLDFTLGWAPSLTSNIRLGQKDFNR